MSLLWHLVTYYSSYVKGFK